MSRRPLKGPESSPFSFLAFFAAAAAGAAGDSRSAATAAEVFLVAAKIQPGDCVEGDASPVPVLVFLFFSPFWTRE